MSIIRSMAKGLTRFPKLKRVMKNVYAYTGNILSDKKTDMPGMIQISSDGADHNFGYYDKSPWSKDQKYMIYLAPEMRKRIMYLIRQYQLCYMIVCLEKKRF